MLVRLRLVMPQAPPLNGFGVAFFFDGGDARDGVECARGFFRGGGVTSPTMIPRYAGKSGTMQGARNDATPAPNNAMS